jgi:plasmid stabilization system protein ParE
VAKIVYSRNAVANLEHAFEFLLVHDANAAAASAVAIRDAVGMLARHPLIGRRIEGEVRELVISFGKTGYVALYRFLPQRDEIRILAIRHQRELDYPA